MSATTKNFEQGKDEVARLCEYFARNQAAFCAAGRKEAHIRQDLIDPFFRALGWDVGNAARVAPQYCEVVVEDSLDVEGQQKAPDYTFRVGTLPKFYVEAKKCGVNIFADPAPAYQLRRYGWSAKVAVSILTDFEELGVYDCTQRPRQADKAGHARILYYRFDEYPDRWRELWDIFSREAVWTGAFDQYAASKRKRGTSEVDVEFLKEIEGWRDELARNIALRNANLSGDELNRAVQVTIDRVVFLRMAEDRGLEPGQQLLTLCEQGDIYGRFIRELCRKADDKYNSGLFHFQKEAAIAEAPDQITPRLAVDDKVFKPILQSLYFAHGSPYEFRVLPVEILGTVYERFLGKVIRLTAGHQAKVEEKPEVRKAGGVYYTPAYIVDYIVRQTVGRQIEGKSPAQLAGKRGMGVPPMSLPAVASAKAGTTGVSPVSEKATHGRDGHATRGQDARATQPLRVLDMACGSGSFLLGAYRCLLEHCLKWYIDNGPEAFPKAVYLARRSAAAPAALSDWRLTITEKKRILLSHIFGVDIDPQAVEVSKLSLLLKVLEGESAESVSDSMRLFHERALPNLSDNIKCGNSLIGPDYFTSRLIPDPKEFARVNAFDWQREFPEAMIAGGFDCIIGNPPYVRQESLKVSKDYFKEYYECFSSAGDLYTYFMERGVKLIRPGGRYSIIVSSSFLRAAYAKALRAVLLKYAALIRIVDFGGLAVFAGAKDTYVCIPLLAKLPQPPSVEIGKVRTLNPVNVLEDMQATEIHAPLNQFTCDAWSLRSEAQLNAFAKILKNGEPLGKYLNKRMFYGVKTGLNEAFVIATPERNELVAAAQNIAGLLHPFVGGENVREYFVEPTDSWLIILPAGWTRSEMGKPGAIASEAKAWDWLRSNYAGIANHLEPFAKALRARQDQGDFWWELRPCDYYEVFHEPKLVFPDICKYPRFAYDDTGIYLTNTAYALGTGDKYLLGILNSRLFWFAISNISIPFGVRAGEFRYRLIYQYMEKVPIRKLDLNKPGERATHDRMVLLVDSMLAMHKQLASAKGEAQRGAIQRQIEATDREIDRLVYDLYGLTEEEIAIVEGTR